MPLVSQTFDQLLDFTRTTAATFVGSNGLIQNTPASVNLLTQTQQFDNAAWSKGNGAITANATTAPDGTATADSFVTTAATAATFVQATFTSLAQSYTASFYVKANGVQYIQLLWAGTQSVNIVNFDIVNGTIGTNTADAGSITATGNGWYRVTITSTLLAAAGAISVYCIPASNSARGASYTGNGTSGIFVWGAQLELGSTAATYTRNNGGRFPARFDYDPVTLAPKGLLIEEQRTNLVTYSEQFDNAAWVKSGVTVTADAIASPDGTVDADTLSATAATTNNIQQNVTLALSTSYRFSVFMKAGTSSQQRILLLNLSPVAEIANALVSWSGGVPTVTGGSPAFTSLDATSVGNGWYRISGSFTTTAASTTYRLSLYPDFSAGTGNVYVYGAQLEAGAFPTSYIPTVASQVTRAADQTSIVAPNFAPWYNQSEGSWVASFSPYAVAGGVVVQIGAATNADRFQLLNANDVQISVSTGNVGQGTIDAGTLSAGATNNLAYAYRTNDTAASLNGGAAVADNTVTLPIVDRLLIGSTVIPANFLNGHMRSIRYYPIRLSNAQLQALTS